MPDDCATTSLASVRTCCAAVLASAQSGQTEFFRVDEDALRTRAADTVLALIDRDYRRDAHEPADRVVARIPPHSRMRHFAPLLPDVLGDARALVDLVVVAVLLDAGADATWTYADARTGRTFRRSEGLAVATQRCFEAGGFSAQPQECPLRVDAARLAALTLDDMRSIFGACDGTNALRGLEGRLLLLRRLASAIGNARVFGPNASRPSDFLPALEARTMNSRTFDMDALWEHIVVPGFMPVWPQRDCWVLRGQPVPFHKLSQWLTYSLADALSYSPAPLTATNARVLTALPEYRNGGFLVDTGVLALTPCGASVTAHGPVPQDHALVVEWRALTVALLDRLADVLRARLGVGADDLPLAKVLEAGTWKAGRELAARMRPNGSPPFDIALDGTLF